MDNPCRARDAFSRHDDIENSSRSSAVYRLDRLDATEKSEDTYYDLKGEYIENYFRGMILESYDLLQAEYNEDIKEGEYDV